MRLIVVGGGRSAYFISKRFLSRNVQVTVILRDPREAEAMALELGARVLCGDGTSALLLRDAEAGRADALVSVLERDEDSLVACLTAQRVFQVPRTVAVLNDPGNAGLFGRLGVSATFSAVEWIARLVEDRATSEEVAAVWPLAGGRTQLTEVVLPQGARAAGVRIRDLHIPRGVLVSLVVRDGEPAVPDGATVLCGGDRLLLISHPDNHGPLLRALLGPRA